MDDFKVVMVLGNGFDLDLGLKTRYSDFMESLFFKENIPKHEINLPDSVLEKNDRMRDLLYLMRNVLLLKNWLNRSECIKYISGDIYLSLSPFRYLVVEIKKKNERDQNMATALIRNLEIDLFEYIDLYRQQKWVDIEMLLSSLALRKDLKVDKNEVRKEAISTEKEKHTFRVLHEALCQYLECLDYSEIIRNSKALILLKIINSYSNSEILSFNYTDLCRLENWIGTMTVPVNYIHGRVSDRSIILGFQDDLEIDDSYCFMIKSFSPHFKSHNVREKLLNADEIIFFGHSLGSTDYHYFQDLFRYQSQPDKANKNLIMRIFTYDENARRDILIQLRNMNDKRTDLLYDLCDFEIYRTGEKADEDKINKYFRELEQRLARST